MASAPTHVVATAAVAAFFYRPQVPWHLWFAGAVLAVAPDLDVIGFHLGVPYGHLLGHRGLSHSPVVAVAAGGLVAFLGYRHGAGPLTATRVWLFLFLATTAHGVLDAFTNGGLGVAFLAPLSAERYFFPFRPLEVSPLSLRRFMAPVGMRILANEILWVWLPALVGGAAVLWYRARARATRAA